MAQLKLKEKKYKEAANLTEKILTVFPQYHPAQFISGISHYFLGNYNQSDYQLTRFLAAEPENLYAIYFLASTYLKQGHPEQSVLILEGIEPEKLNANPELLKLLGRSYSLSGEPVKGLNFFEKARKLVPKDIEVQKDMTKTLFQIGKSKSGTLALEQIIEKTQDKQSYYLLIIDYLVQNKLDLAEKKIKQLLAENPSDPGAYNLLAMLENSKGNRLAAIKNYHRAIEFNPEYTPAYLSLARLYFDQGELDKAAKECQHAIETNKSLPNPYIILAVIYQQQQKSQLAEQQLRLAYQHAKKSFPIKMGVALVIRKWYLKQQQPKKLLSFARQLVEDFPNQSQALAFLAEAQISNNKLLQAEYTLRNIIRNNNQDTQYRFRLASILSQDPTRNSETVELLNKIIKLKPNEPLGLITRFYFELKNNHFDAALATADQLTKQFPGSRYGWQSKGDYFIAVKQYHKALNAYQKAYETQPDNKLIVLISSLMNALGETRQAIDFLKDVLHDDTTNPDALYKLAEIYQVNKQNNKAIQYYNALLSQNANNILALNNLAWIYFAKKDPKALKLAKKAYENSKNTPITMDTYGYMLLKLRGDQKKSLRLLKQASSLSPRSNDIKYHLSIAYANNGHKDEAVALLKPLALDMRFAQRKEAEQLLKTLQ